MSQSCFIHLSTDGHLGCSHTLEIVNNTTVNIGVLMFFRISVPLGMSPEVGSLGLKADPFLICWGISTLLSSMHQSVFPPTVQNGSPFSTSLPALVVCWLIDESHSDRCEMISHCGFNLHFSHERYKWYGASFHMPVGHLYVLFKEVSIQVLCPLFNWFFVFFGVEFLSSLQILDINP